MTTTFDPPSDQAAEPSSPVPAPIATVAPDAEIALRVRGLSKTYRTGRGNAVPVLRGFDLDVQVGEWVALTGKSGSGKTTLLQLLGTLDTPDSGAIECFGRDLSKLWFFERAKFRRTYFGFIFQSYHLFPELSALENVMLAGRITGIGHRANTARAHELLDRVGLADRVRHRPAELSGGEQQRVAIARSLLNRPRLILADEPTGNLDAGNSESIMRALQEIRKEENLTIIMVTHDLRISRQVDRALHLVDGQLAPGAAFNGDAPEAAPSEEAALVATEDTHPDDPEPSQDADPTAPGEPERE